MKKLMFIIPFLLLLSLFSVYADNLACTIITPLSSGTLTNNTLLNLSFTGGSGNATITATWNITSASTRNSSSLTQIVLQRNLTGAVLMANGSINSSFPNSAILEDSNDYVLTASVNGSDGAAQCGSTSTSILVDRTKPDVPSAITFSNPVKAADTITATIDRNLANRCFIRFGTTSTARNAMTLSGATCTFTVQKDSPPNSDYSAFIEADDRTNSTFSTAQNIVIRGSVSDGGGIYGGQAILNAGQSNQGQSILGGGSSNPLAPKSTGLSSIPPVGWILIAVVAYLIFVKKK